MKCERRGIFVPVKLEAYCDGAHLFHGSEAAGLKSLAPFEPNDVGADLTNKDHAVYATDDLCAAIIFALTRGFDGVWRLTRNPTTAHFPSAFANELRRNHGSVYVLPRGAFGTKKGWQYKALEAVAPIAEIVVSLDDYLGLGGLLDFRE
jgi:hypothetical protein